MVQESKNAEVANGVTPELKILINQISSWEWELNAVFTAGEATIDKRCFDETMKAMAYARENLVNADKNFRYRMDRVKEEMAHNPGVEF